MREDRTYGSEGGESEPLFPTPISLCFWLSISQIERIPPRSSIGYVTMVFDVLANRLPDDRSVNRRPPICRSSTRVSCICSLWLVSVFRSCSQTRLPSRLCPLDSVNRIAVLGVLVLALVSAYCRHSNGIEPRPNNNANPPASDQSDSFHRGTSQMLSKRKLKGIKAIALANDCKSLLVSDGTILGEGGIDLEVLSVDDLRRTASFTISDDMSDGYPWSSPSVVVDRAPSHVLLYNQYIDLDAGKPTSALEVQDAVGKRNVSPTPLSISPNGKSALVCVGSYSSRALSTLATFNLATGELERRISRGRNMEQGCACFLDDDRIVAVGRDGVITVHDLRDETDIRLKEIVRTGPILKGKHLRVQPFDDGKRLVITGDKDIVVLDMIQQTVLFRKSRANGNAIVNEDETLLLWQRKKWIPRKSTDDSRSPGRSTSMLAVADIRTGTFLGEYSLPTHYDLLLLDDASGHVFAAHYSELHKLSIDLSKIKTE